MSTTRATSRARRLHKDQTCGVGEAVHAAWGAELLIHRIDHGIRACAPRAQTVCLSAPWCFSVRRVRPTHGIYGLHSALKIVYFVASAYSVNTQIAVSAFVHCALRIAYLVDDTQIAVSAFVHCALRIAHRADCRECVCALRIAYCASSRLP